MTKQNLHTHSTYCDGIDTLEDIVKEGILEDFDSIGFSSHAYTGFAFDDCGIESEEKVSEYIKEIADLKKKYQDRIKIYTGLELESKNDNIAVDKRLDYSIGSVHCFWFKDKVFSVDYTPEMFEEARDYIGGIRELIENYYNEIIRFASISNYDITGHIDLVTKFNEIKGWDFEKESWYRDIAIAALDCAIDNDKLIEVNTGAISRGYRTTPYPAPFLLERAKERNAHMILSSDCHNKKWLSYEFNSSLDRLKEYGFSNLYFLTEEGFKPEAI